MQTMLRLLSWMYGIEKYSSGADPGILVRGGVKIAGSTDRQNFILQILLSYRLNYF